MQKNQLNPWTHSANFWVSWTKWPIFDQAHPKIIEITFWLPEFAPACKKSVHSIYSILRYSQFQSPLTRLATTISDNAHPKIFWSTFNLCEFVSTWKKLSYFIDLSWRYGWLKNPTIWLAENILTHISGTRIFPKYIICAETANNINFHYRTNSGKLMTKFFNILKKILFLAHFCPFSQFLGQKQIFWKIRLCHAQLHTGF